MLTLRNGRDSGEIAVVSRFRKDKSIEILKKLGEFLANSRRTMGRQNRNIL